MKVLAIGDAMIDKYWWGDVVRISPEHPVPVVNVTNEQVIDGAVLNVAANINAMGFRCDTLYGNGERIVKLRIMGHRRNGAPVQAIARIDFDSPQEPIQSVPPGYDAYVFCDYGKGSLRYAHVLVAQAKSYGALVLVDPKGHDFRAYCGVDVLKPNLVEASVLYGNLEAVELSETFQGLRVQNHIGAILLTKASDGMTLYTDEGAYDSPSMAIEVKDVTGAGESAIAAFTASLLKGFTLTAATEHANKAAAVACMGIGPTVVSGAEVFN